MIHAAPFEMRTEIQDGSARLMLVGELDIAAAPRVEEAVGLLLAQGARELVLDLTGLRFIDSSGLRMFIILSDRAKAEGWRLGLVRPAGQAASLFSVTRAEQSLPFIEDPHAER